MVAVVPEITISSKSEIKSPEVNGLTVWLQITINSRSCAVDRVPLYGHSPIPDKSMTISPSGVADAEDETARRHIYCAVAPSTSLIKSRPIGQIAGFSPASLMTALPLSSCRSQVPVPLE